MELTDLKSIWKKVVDEQGAKYQLDEQHVRSVIHKKSNATISKVKRELRLKGWMSGAVGILTIILAPVFLFENNDHNYPLDTIFSRLEMSTIMLFVGIILLALFINIIISYKKITTFQRTSDNLKLTIRATIELLKRIVKLGIFSEVISVPFVVTWIAYKKLFQDDGLILDIRLLYLSLIALTVIVLKYHLIKYFQNRKFGPYIDSLQECLDDIDYLEKDSE